jgi:uncharacterized protein (TIGR03437 family)
LCGQFSQLATTDDGSQIYFVTSLRLRTEASLRLPRSPAIYRLAGDAPERYTVPPPLDFAFPKSHGNPQVSGDGTVVSYTLTNACSGGSTCALTYPTTHYSFLFVRSQAYGQVLGGHAQVSRNGRYVLNAGRWSSMTQRAEFRELRDLQTGETFEVRAWPSSNRQALTGDGAVLGFDLQDNSLVLWNRQGLRRVSPSMPVGRAVIDDTGRRVIYETIGTSAPSDLRALELDSGSDILLARGRHPLQPSISNDGALVLYVAEPVAGEPRQAFLIQPDGGGNRQLTRFPEGVEEAVLAGGGAVALAATPTGRLVRIRIRSGDLEELIPATPAFYSLGGLVVAPGSVYPLTGRGWTAAATASSIPLPRELDGIQVLADGEPWPLLRVSPGEILFQVPFETQSGRTMRLELKNSSMFDTSQEVLVKRRQPYLAYDSEHLLLVREDYRSRVTREDPARPGEILHGYAIGLGPVIPEAETGVPAPLDRLLWVTDPFDCRMGPVYDWKPVEVLFAGLAPGMIGMYQFTMRLPESLPSGSFLLHCGSPDDNFLRHGGLVPALRMPPRPAQSRSRAQ